MLCSAGVMLWNWERKDSVVWHLAKSHSALLSAFYGHSNNYGTCRGKVGRCWGFWWVHWKQSFSRAWDFFWWWRTMVVKRRGPSSGVLGPLKRNANKLVMAGWRSSGDFLLNGALWISIGNSHQCRLPVLTMIFNFAAVSSASLLDAVYPSSV